MSASIATDDAVWDGLGTLSIGVLLVVIAIFLAVEMKSLLIGESATDSDQLAIRKAIESDPDVRSLIHIRTEHIGPEELLVAAKIELENDLDVESVAATIDRVETALRAAVPAARVIYLEPDLRRTTGAAVT